MSTFAGNFINVETAVGFPPARGREFTTRVLEMVSRTSTDLPRPERTLWFPPGEYAIAAPFSFPDAVTLSFAPGARLVPVRSLLPGDVVADVIEIAGKVDAPLSQIFAVDVVTVTYARVAFVGSGTPRVHPEWWGAARDSTATDPRLDSAALRAAIRAAVIDREALSGGASRPPLPIAFSNVYYLDGSIRVEPATPSGLLGAIIFEGLRDRESSGVEMGAPEETVFDFRWIQQVTLRNLAIRIFGNTRTAVSVLVSRAQHPVDHSVVFERCSVDGAFEQQLHIQDNSTVPHAAGAFSIALRECTFALSEEARVRSDHEGRSTTAGIRVDAAFGADLSVDASRFGGYLSRGLHTTGGVRSKVTACAFSFRSPAAEYLPNGAAIHLARTAIPRASPPRLDAFACVAATPSFLWVDSPRPAEAQKSPEAFAIGINVILTGITHLVDRNRGLGLYWPPAVVWRGGPSLAGDVDDPLGDSRLTLVGCNFEVPPALPTAVPVGATGQAAFTEDQRVFQRFGVLPRVPRVFTNANLRQLLNVGTFREDFPPPALGAFRRIGSPYTITSSLGPGAAMSGPLVARLPFDFIAPGNPYNLLFAWAIW